MMRAFLFASATDLEGIFSGVVHLSPASRLEGPTPFADSYFARTTKKWRASISSLLLPEKSLFRRKNSLFDA